MRLRAVIFSAISVAILASIGIVLLASAAQPAHAQELTQHRERKDIDKGPRALGLVQITDTGKARIIPVAIMMNGKFFDAGSYKADPVPMALDFGIVYEGFRTGVSQGLFTITQPGQLNHEWIAEGSWLPEGAKPKTDKRKYEPPVIDEGVNEDHPVLHRRAGGEADKDDAKPAASTASPSSPTTTPSTSPSSAPSSTSTSSGTAQTPASTTAGASKDSDKSSANKTPDAGATKPSESASSKPSDSATASDSAATRRSDNQPISDPNRPILRRGKPDPNAHHEPFVNFDDPAAMAAVSKQAGKEATAAKAAAASSVQTVAAISDAAGPDPRPYTYDLKPAEEAIYRNQMLELAGQQLRPKTPPGAASARKKTSSAKSVKPELEDVRLRIFDLSNSNEPILVLSARTPVPPATAPGTQVPQEITLIARTNLEGELHKLFFAQTDSRHLDLSPRMELIDAVDADGDGRGELLFRRTFGSGSAYAIYRVTADQLWPLWEPLP